VPNTVRFKSRNDFDQSHGRFFEVDYQLSPLHMKQKRMLGRFVLAPEINLANYRCSAVIDWLDLRISLRQNTQQQWIGLATESIAGRRAYVEPIDPGLGNSANEFRIRFQEPDLRQVRALVQDLHTNKGGVLDAKLVGVEVSVDYYAKDDSELARARLYSVIARHLFIDVLDMKSDLRRPRSYGSRRKTLTLVKTIGRNRANVLRALEDATSDYPPALSSTFYVGVQDDPDYMIRLQHKITDRRNPSDGSFEILPEAKRRVRLEVTLGAQGLSRFGLVNLDHLEAFSFTRLSTGAQN
jgi:hypothetical protein